MTKLRTKPPVGLYALILGMTLMLCGTALRAVADCVALPDGAVGWWRAEGNANDWVGLNRGTLRGGVTFASGKVGQAFSFNGSGTSILVPDNPVLRFTNAMTIEVWICPTAQGGSAQELVSKWFGSGNQLSYTTSIDPSGQIYFLVSSDGLTSTAGVDYTVVYTSNSAPTNQWSHFAATYDGAWLSVYLNGSLENQTPWYQGIFPGTPPLVIGAAWSESFFHGLMDEPTLYSRALSYAEIQAIYFAGVAGKCTNIPPLIITQPTDQTVAVGANLILSATASGPPPLGYQWQLNGTNMGGTSSSALILTNVQMTQAGVYTLQVINPFGFARSSNAVLTINPAPPCAAPPAGLMSWWRAEGNGWDQVGGNSGTFQNGATFAAGRTGQAFSFDGVSGCLVSPDSSSLRLTNQLTIEAWINTRSTNANRGIVSKVGGTGGNNGYQLLLSYNTLGGQFNSPGQSWPSATVSYPGAVVPGVWTHVAWTYDQSAMKLYLNGQPVATNVIGPKTIAASSSNLRISGDDGNHGYFDGLIDEVSIYNRALSDGEIAAIYNADPSGKCIVTVQPFMIAQPTNQTTTLGGSATFVVGVGGTPPFGYQWTFNGAVIAGGTSNPLTLTNMLLSQAGSYSVAVTNAVGSLTSSNAALTVNYPPPQVRVFSANAVTGSVVTLPVVVVANGNENALSFSLSFDTTKLIYVGASLGAGAIGADLIPNTSLINSGKLGLSLALPPYTTLSEGTQQVVQVAFAVPLVSATSTTISFGDQPTFREVSDPQLNLVAANYSSGSVTISAAAAFEGDVYPRPNGDKSQTILDWLEMGRFVVRLDYPTNGAEFQRADCAPRSILGDGAITVSDWVQIGRYLAGLDPLTAAGGPTSEVAIVGAGPSASRLLSVGQSVLVPGQTAALPVTLSAQGNENAMGVSLAFDPTRVNFTGAVLGADAAGATLYLNTNQVGSGQLGLALALGTGGSFAPGTRELVRLYFLATSFSSGSSSVSPTDQPVPREICDANALALPASYANGTITINLRPSLRIARSGQNVTLAWPLWATNFGLQVASGRLPPSAAWTNLPATPILSNNEASVTLPQAGTNRYYRLHYP